MKQHNSFITLTDELGKGGEATVYNVAQQPDMVAKLYHQPTPERAAKLRAMLLNPPEQPKNHTALAWPTALLYRQDGRLHAVTPPDANASTGHVVGFLMPKVSDRQALFHIYNPMLRQQLPYSVDSKFLYRTATNLAVVVSALHARGYVIGDINESNILVNRQALVTLVDCDSFQVADATGYIHRCNVGKPEFTPPELQGVSLKTVDQLPEHDLFGLGVLLFQLLVEGYHPFAGVLQSQASVGRVDLYAIRQGLFPYGDEPSISPPPAAPQFGWLHPEVQQLFLACFRLGHDTPAARPSGLDWRPVLALGEKALQRCEKAGHRYSPYLTACPYCQQLDVASDVSTVEQPVPIQPLSALMPQALEVYRQSDRAAMLRVLESVFAYDKLPAQAYAYRAWAYQSQNNPKAVTYAEKALFRNANNALACFVLGVCAYENEAYDDALTRLTKAINQGHTPIAEAYYYRALVYREQKQYEDALQNIQQQLKAEKDVTRQKKGQALQAELRQLLQQERNGVQKESKPDPLAFILIMVFILMNPLVLERALRDSGEIFSCCVIELFIFALFAINLSINSRR